MNTLLVLSIVLILSVVVFGLVNNSVNKPKPEELQEIEYPCNEINSVGFPEGQLLPHCNGDDYLCGELSAAYHLGKPFPATGNEVLDRICDRLSQLSGYGRYK
jgi:hypothetical protein